MNPKKVRELSGLTQEQIARTLDLTLNGWQRKEQFNTGIKVELTITEKLMAELLQVAHANKMSVGELLGRVIEHIDTQDLKKLAKNSK